MSGEMRHDTRAARAAAAPGAARLLFLAAFLAASAPASAGPTGAFRIPAQYRSWTVKGPDGKSTISQMEVPLVVSVAAGGHADLVVSSAAGFSSFKPEGGSKASLDGARNLNLELYLRPWKDRLLVRGGIGAPTGKVKLDPDELTVAAALGQPLLGFRMKQYGEGFNAGGGVALAFPAGSLGRVGIGAGWIHHGAYTLIRGSEAYTPGQETSISAGLDAGARDAARPPLRLDATYRAFGKDRMSGEAIFREGAQLELSLDAHTGSSRARGRLLERAVIKNDNKVYSGAGATLAEIKQRSGTWNEVVLGFDVPLGRSVRAGLEGTWDHLGGSDLAGADGDAYGVGPTCRAGLGPETAIVAGAEVLTGSLKAKDAFPKRDLRGVQLTAGLVWRAGQ